MWGDLWIFPFDVTIWGTVASWFSAIISSLSIFAAAAYYIIDKWQAAKSQARHVRFVRCYWTKFAVKAEVHNHSDESIFDVTVLCGRRPFRDYINRLMDSRPVEMDELPGLLEAWQALPGGNVQVRSFRTPISGQGNLFQFTTPERAPLGLCTGSSFATRWHAHGGCS